MFQKLTKVATLVANAVYRLANEGNASKVPIEADEAMVGAMMVSRDGAGTGGMTYMIHMNIKYFLNKVLYVCVVC